MVDREKVERAVRLLLEGIGEDVTREGLVETPARIARMYEEICSGMGEDAKEHLRKTFTVDNNEMVVEKEILHFILCVNTICFHFTARFMWHISRMEKWLD